MEIIEFQKTFLARRWGHLGATRSKLLIAIYNGDK